MPKLAKKIAQVREHLDNSLIASLDTPSEKALEFLEQEEEKLNQHKDRSTKLMEYQVKIVVGAIYCFQRALKSGGREGERSWGAGGVLISCLP